MTRGEYLSAVEEQIRCRQVKSMVREELEAHMEDQKEAYLQEGKSVKETAHLLGFNDQNYFSTVFKRITGTPPKEFIPNSEESFHF